MDHRRPRGMIYIVGSGPAGIASARALLTRGLEVTMLDAGLDLEPERAEVVRRLGSLPPERWSNSDRDYLRDGPAPTVRGILRKGIYGSTYPYRPLGDTPLVEESADVGAVPSYARGGLSNVWGAGVLPYAEDKFANWPVSRADLAPHFEAVLRMLPLAGAPDRRERRFPLYTEDLGPLDLSQQASAFLGDLEGRGNELEQAGFAFGRSRLAVRTRPAGADAGCVYCGLCLHGCPYRLIYSTAATLDTFIAEEPRFHYVPGVVVQRVREAGTTVTIEGTDGTGMPRSFVGTRVFLACGTLSTTRVVLESMRAYETPVRFKDSQYFLVPVLRRAAVSDVESESLHTMCQLFLRWQPPFAARATHLSVYTYNGFYRQAIERMLGPTSLLIGTLLPPVLSRLLIIQGHLPCNLSASITARLVRERPRRAGEAAPFGGRHLEISRRAEGGRAGACSSPAAHARRGSQTADKNWQARERFLHWGQPADEPNTATLRDRRTRATVQIRAYSRRRRKRLSVDSRHTHYAHGHGQRAPHRVRRGLALQYRGPRPLATADGLHPTGRRSPSDLLMESPTQQAEEWRGSVPRPFRSARTTA